MMQCVLFSLPFLFFPFHLYFFYFLVLQFGFLRKMLEGANKIEHSNWNKTNASGILGI